MEFIPKHSSGEKNLNQLQKMEIPINYNRVQNENYGANIKGKNFVVQSRTRHINSRAFLDPYVTHLLSVALKDASLSSIEAEELFSYLQKIS